LVWRGSLELLIWQNFKYRIFLKEGRRPKGAKTQRQTLRSGGEWGTDEVPRGLNAGGPTLTRSPSGNLVRSMDVLGCLLGATF
jgi:hypothetical protein